MIKSILIVLGIVLFIWFLLPVFSFRIVNIGNITGMAVSLVLLFYGIFFRQFNHFIVWFWHKSAGRVIEIVIGACILAIIVLAVMTTVCMLRGMSVPKEARSAGDKKTVIVLGCKTIGERPSLMLEERLQAAYEYLAEHPEVNAIVSGGQGEDETMAEADVMFNWLVDRGIAPERIYKEDRSTDTHENLAYCYDILAGLAPYAEQKETASSTNQAGTGLAASVKGQSEVGGADDVKTESSGADEAIKAESGRTSAAEGQMDRDRFKVVLVTNEFHEYRALRIAASYGFDAEPLPAKTAWWLFPTYYVREMYGILEDWFLVR